jgi:multidrug efflux system membrane fusion protein
VRVKLFVDDLPDALLVPQVAVGSNQLGKYVYVVGPDNRVSSRAVTLGAVQGRSVIVTSGVQAGERVVTSNLQRLSNGSAITIQPDAAGDKKS